MIWQPFLSRARKKRKGKEKKRAEEKSCWRRKANGCVQWRLPECVAAAQKKETEQQMSGPIVKVGAPEKKLTHKEKGVQRRAVGHPPWIVRQGILCLGRGWKTPWKVRERRRQNSSRRKETPVRG